MSIESVMVAAMRANATIAGLASTRIYPIALPKEPTYPAIVYQLVSRQQAEHHPLGKFGPSAMDSRYQFDCWASWGAASSFASAGSLADGVKAALLGLMATQPVDVVIENEMDFNEPEVLAFRRVVEVLLVHGEGL